MEECIRELQEFKATMDWALFDAAVDKLKRIAKPKTQCPDCDKAMLFSSLQKHRAVCKGAKAPKAPKAKSVITLTFGDMAENHVGMEQIGKMVEEGQGFQLADLQHIQGQMEEKGARTEMVALSEEAHVLIIRDGVNVLLPDSKERIFEEHVRLEHDKKALMYGRVVNKLARWNLCYDEESREPDYEKGKGRIVGYDEVPLTKRLKEQIEMFGEKARDLKIEGNYYYDVRKCGIGFHGDSERRKVIGVRLGTASLPLHFQWYLKGKPVDERIVLELEPGDIYLMSEIAVGTNWKKKNIRTLRHGTGEKFT